MMKYYVKGESELNNAPSLSAPWSGRQCDQLLTSSCQPAFPTMSDCTIQLWAKITLLSASCFWPGYQVTANKKVVHTESLVQAIQAHGRLTLKSSFQLVCTRNGSLRV